MIWLLDTLVWTGVLIGFVLLVRRPVSRLFGPQIAYALWLLPTTRLILPAITLPAWMNPAPQAAVPAAETVYILSAEGAVPAAPAGASEGVLAGSILPFDLWPFVLAAWLSGAALFLANRFRAYFEMRRELLADAREVGREGNIRLVETPATNTPLAFGVLDKVVALPPRFLALSERPVRDLALAHEIAHHRGGDLIVNFAVQPLFALHWFNPLGWVGWRALRRDQEAACDARVVGTADAEMRATYAHTIASFAAGPRVALAAPMACPVLGDKSIIHRLRSLKMSDISKTRRWGGRAMLLAGALALPLTASISYAETVPAPPVPPSAELPPAPPAPPAPPKAPTAPLAWTQEGGSGETAGTAEDGETERRVIIERDAREGSDGKTIVIRTKDKDGKVRLTERKVQHMAFFSDDGEVLTEAEIEKLEKQIEKRMKLKEKDFEAIGQDIEKRMEMQFGKDFEERLGRKMCSDEDQRNVSIQTRDGAMKIATCAKAFIADTRTLVTHSLKKAREAIKMERNLTDEQRSEALKGIDEAISELNARG